MLRKLLSRGTNNATPVNPLIIQNKNTTQVTEHGRHLQQLHNPITMTLISKDELATDTFVYRFALPEEHASLGHFTC
jgi:NAD(P)H-flavin reductase